VASISRSSWPGFVPAIHVCQPSMQKKDVDARHRAGHDEMRDFAD